MLLYLIQHIFSQAPVFVLVLFRLSGMMVLAPLLGLMSIPVQIKIFIALLLSMAVFPLVPSPELVPNSLMGLAVAVAGEMLIGISMGFVLTLFFAGIQFGAELISYQMGFAMARLVDPMTQVSTTVISQFYILLASLIYILMNGHLILIKSLAKTFQTVPMLAGFEGRPVLDMSINILAEAFKLGVRMAGPALTAVFLASAALGFISRTMPQLNILAAGFPIRITLAFVLLIASLAMTGVLYQDGLIMVFRQIGYIFN